MVLNCANQHCLCTFMSLSRSLCDLAGFRCDLGLSTLGSASTASVVSCRACELSIRSSRVLDK